MATDIQAHSPAQAALSDALRVSFRALRAVMVALLAIYLLSGLFVVRQHEKAFVLMLGRVRGVGAERLLGPGIHWTFPRPLAEVVRIPAERVQSVETDTFWYFVAEKDRLRGQEPPPGPRLDPRKDGYVLSGDANLLHSRWALRYTVADPERHVFGLQDPETALRLELDHAIVKISARFLIDQALRTDVEAFRAAVDEELRRRCRELDLGIEVQRVDVLSVVPPRQVAAAFDAVVEAEQERSRAVSEARAYAARARNEAAGEAARVVAEGEAYKERLVSKVRADADYFEAVHEKYVKNPEITARTLLQDTLRRVLTRVQEKYVVRRGEGGQELWLKLGPRGEEKGKP
ncbi:MAG: FtsH protease activity modulator HflK [Kiritimatiellae bacterium]|nr:FtsH protease activity modulator HflK [Kiritimatiellia bacterium]